MFIHVLKINYTTYANIFSHLFNTYTYFSTIGWMNHFILFTGFLWSFNLPGPRPPTPHPYSHPYFSNLMFAFPVTLLVFSFFLYLFFFLFFFNSSPTCPSDETYIKPRSRVERLPPSSHVKELRVTAHYEHFAIMSIMLMMSGPLETCCTG